MNITELNFIKKTYEDNLLGYYYPDNLTKAYQLITGNVNPVLIRQKKQAIFAFINYQYENELEKLVKEVELEVVKPKLEKIETKKSTTRKKRTIKRK